MNNIDFENAKPCYINGEHKWYIADELQQYINNKQAENLPKLTGFGCFVVKGLEKTEYALIGSNRNLIDVYPYNFEGYCQMEAKINFIKIAQHYDEQGQ